MKKFLLLVSFVSVSFMSAKAMAKDEIKAETKEVKPEVTKFADNGIHEVSFVVKQSTPLVKDREMKTPALPEKSGKVPPVDQAYQPHCQKGTELNCSGINLENVDSELRATNKRRYFLAMPSPPVLRTYGVMVPKRATIK